MDTLMRTLKLLALVVVVVIGAPLAVNAQPPVADDSRFFFTVSLGGQSKEQILH